MTAVIFSTLAAATKLRDYIDTRLGLPRDGVDIGGGVHVPAALSRTLTSSIPIAHPTLTEWTVPIRASWATFIQDAINAGKLPADTQIVTLTADWFPSSP